MKNDRLSIFRWVNCVCLPFIFVLFFSRGFFLVSFISFSWLVPPVFLFLVFFSPSELWFVLDDFSSCFFFLGRVVLLLVFWWERFLGVCVLVGCIVCYGINSFLWFLVVFEWIVFPVSLLVWCGLSGERFLSVLYILVYTLFFRIPFFLVVVVFFNRGIDIFSIRELPFELSVLGLFMFLVKFPIFLLHSWLPRAHVEAPTVGSIILASCLLKVGRYGFGRFFRVLYRVYVDWVFCFGLLGSLLRAICCLFSVDLKALIAFSSVFHMSFLLGGLCFFSDERLVSCAFVSCAHGFVSVALFYFAGIIYSNLGRRSLIYRRIFNVFFMWVIFLGGLFFFNSSFPLSLSFFSEFFVLKQIWSFCFSSFFVMFLALLVGGIFISFLVWSIFSGKIFFSVGFCFFFIDFLFVFLVFFWRLFFWGVV